VDKPSFVQNPQTQVDANVLATSSEQRGENDGDGSDNFVVKPTGNDEKVVSTVDDKIEVSVDESDSPGTQTNDQTELVVEAPSADPKPDVVATSQGDRESYSRALSEISPTFSMQGSDESEYKVVRGQGDAVAESTDVQKNDAQEPDVEVADFDRWDDVFLANNPDAREVDSTDDENEQDDDRFGDYLESESDDEEELEEGEDADYDFDEDSEELEDE